MLLVSFDQVRCLWFREEPHPPMAPYFFFFSGKKTSKSCSPQVISRCSSSCSSNGSGTRYLRSFFSSAAAAVSTATGFFISLRNSVNVFFVPGITHPIVPVLYPEPLMRGGNKPFVSIHAVGNLKRSATIFLNEHVPLIETHVCHRLGKRFG
jgi:hypothetical protein